MAEQEVGTNYAKYLVSGEITDQNAQIVYKTQLAEGDQGLKTAVRLNCVLVFGEPDPKTNLPPISSYERPQLVMISAAEKKAKIIFTDSEGIVQTATYLLDEYLVRLQLKPRNTAQFKKYGAEVATQFSPLATPRLFSGGLENAVSSSTNKGRIFTTKDLQAIVYRADEGVYQFLCRGKAPYLVHADLPMFKDYIYPESPILNTIPLVPLIFTERVRP